MGAVTELQSQESPHMILLNGKIVTVDDFFSIQNSNYCKIKIFANVETGSKTKSS